MEENFRSQIKEVIDEFEKNRTAILKKAYESGGQESVTATEQKYDDLASAYYEILKNELDKNNLLYTNLISVAKTETEKLKASVKQLNNINEIIELTTSVINLSKQIISILAI